MIAERMRQGRFATEEVSSSYKYPKNYKVRNFIEQATILQRLFLPNLKTVAVLPERSLPKGAEGWFAIPKWQKVAATYNEAVEIVLALIASQREFYSYYQGQGQLGADHLRQHSKTAKMFAKLSDQQNNCDILVIPAQFGFRHRGRSVRRAREVFAKNEFGLGAFAIGTMLLTHWERFHHRNLWIDCPGDECDDSYDEHRFSRAPYFTSIFGQGSFGAYRFDNAEDFRGSASGFA